MVPPPHNQHTRGIKIKYRSPQNIEFEWISLFMNIGNFKFYLKWLIFSFNDSTWIDIFIIVQLSQPNINTCKNRKLSQFGGQPDRS